MTMLRVHLFGGLKLAWDDDPLPTIPGPTARSLFAYLVTYRDRSHTRDLLAGTFWPDLPDATARRRLSKALWQIRRTFRLAPDAGRQSRSGGIRSLPVALVTEGGTVQINPSLSLWLDAEEFEQQVIDSRQQAFGPAVDGLLRAVGLYRGGFLAGYYHDWVLVERERLLEMLLEALSRLVVGYKVQGELASALRYARRLVAEEPWREEAHREVMQLCHLLGEDAEALKQFETCCQSLARELGAEPSPETVALADEIATRSGLSRPPLLPATARPVTTPHLERPDRLPLVGRRKELAELLRQVEATAERTGGLTLVYGEAGVGKSRLLREVAENARWRGVRTAWGRCYELAAPPAYQPLVEALRADLPALEKAALEPLWRAELSRILPELATGGGPPPSLSPEEEQRRLLEAIARGFLALAEITTPSLVLLEDAQWMDRSSLEALRYLLPRLGETPLLVLVTARPEELEGPQAAVLSAMESTRLARRLELGGLSQAETMELVQRALDLEEPAPRFSARLHAETEGNPFFLIDTLWALVEEGLLYRDEAGAWSTQWDESTEDYAELPLPAGVMHSIERRLDRLPGGLNELLDLAAVIGRGVDFALWHAASRRDEADLLMAGDRLGSHGLLLAGDPATPGDADYVFAHDQIRRLAYRRLAPPRRRRYHRRIAQALEDLAPGEPAPLAYHWTQAEVWDRAVACHRQAGDRAGSVYAHAEAADHYTQALEALEGLTRQTGLPDLARCFELHLSREAVYALEGKRTTQANDLSTLEALAERLEDDQRRIAVALRQGKYHAEIGDCATALGYLETVLTLARAIGDRQREASGLAGLSSVHLSLGEFAASLTNREEALAIFRTLGDRQQEARNLSACGTLYLLLGRHSLAQDCCERALALCRAAGDHQGEARSLYTLSRTLSALGDLAQAREYLLPALNITQATGDRYREAYYRLELGNHNYRLGEYRAARELLEQAKAIFLQINEMRGHGYALVDLGLVYHALGDEHTALDYCTRGRDLLRTVGDRWGEAGCLQHLGLVMEELGDWDSAADVYTQASIMNQQIEQPERVLENRLGLARVALAHGRIAEALEPVEDMAAWIGAKGIQSLDFPFVGYMTIYKVLAAAGDTERARTVLTEAYDVLMGRAEKLEDSPIRDLFLEKVAVHREIVAAYRDLQAPQQGHLITVSLPRADAPLGRPLREDEYLAVTWTVDDPGDEAITGKVARRRHQILRLLRQAQAQGAAPTHTHLAEALGVSRRTIERDMAALHREQPGLPPTRGKMSE
jgi:DNA-binding SARP family transcriptional activator/tetratricopeptide (TPR) repeat protein